MMMKPDALYGPLKKKWYCAKMLIFVVCKITSFKGRWVEPEMGNTPKRHFWNIEINMEYRLHFSMRELDKKIVRNKRKWNFQTLKQRDRKSTGDTKAVDDEEEEVQEVQRPMGRDKNKRATSYASPTSGNEEALARLMVNEYTMINEL
nr:hypothetical protein [Tanacetum cinerariifolium]